MLAGRRLWASGRISGYTGKEASCPLTSVGSQRQAACVLTEASEMECGRLGRQMRSGNQQSGVMMESHEGKSCWGGQIVSHWSKESDLFCQHLPLWFQQRGRLGRMPWLVWLVLVEVKTDTSVSNDLVFSYLYFCSTRFEEISFWNPHRMNKKPTWIVWGFWLFRYMRAVQLVFQPQVLIWELCGRCYTPSAENMLFYGVHTSQSARYWLAVFSLWI